MGDVEAGGEQGGRWVETRESGHWVHMTEPEVVAEVVRLVVENVGGGGEGAGGS